MSPGDWIWYQPSPGVRFAGVVMGSGALAGTLRVCMTDAYWRMSRGGSGTRPDLPAVDQNRCYPRDTRVPGLDE